jgi:hypothetical protein
MLKKKPAPFDEGWKAWWQTLRRERFFEGKVLMEDGIKVGMESSSSGKENAHWVYLFCPSCFMVRI